MGGGGKGGSSTQTVQIPPEVLARYNAVNAQAQQIAGINPCTGQPNTPFKCYSTTACGFVAGINPTQQSGINNIVGSQNAAAPSFQTALGLTQGAAGAINPNALCTQKYMNPYIQCVVGSSSRLLQQQQAQQMAGQTGNAIRSGAFGGDRAGIAAANLAGQQNLAYANAINPLLSAGYTQAQGVAQQQQGVCLAAQQANAARQLQAAQQLGGLGAAAQNAAITGGQAALAAGTAQQQTCQAGKTALYNQFLQKQGYPFQTTQFLANIAEGTGALSGSTTNTSTSGGAFASDARLKENIEPVGKTYDGQTVYRYNYKGDPKTHIGLIAQEVEHKHPKAVGLAGGYKTVNYDDATKDSAKRGHFAQGGLIGDWMGGAVTGGDGRQHYASGGSCSSCVSPYLAQMGMMTPAAGLGNPLAIQQMMYANMLKQNGLSIPQKGPSGLSPLKPAPAPQQHTPDTIGDISKGIGALKTGRDLYKDWKTPDPNAPKTTDRAAPDNPNTGNTTVGKTANANPVKTPDKVASGDTNNIYSYDPNANTIGSSTQTAGLNPVKTPDEAANTTTRDGLGGADKSIDTASLNSGDNSLGDLSSGLDVSNLNTDVADASSDLSGGLGDVGDFVARGGFMRNKFADGGESSILPYQSADNIVPNSVLQDGEDEARADQREFESLQPHGGGGGGGGGGFNPLSLVGPAVSLFSLSDKNLKHNIQEVGRTFDGQPIYKFRYKGEDSYQIGLIAQNVEKQHPNAVSKSHGLKLVNYKTATDDAAHRGHFASGGLAGNRQGYATAGGGGLLPTTDDNSASISPSIDPNAINAPQGDLVSSPTDDILNRADRAIKTIESGSPDGNYKAIGPDVKRKDGTIDNGYGAHQVMGSNIPSWTKEALGQPLTKEEFLASPEAQDATFRYHFGKNLQKFGNPQDAASVWFTGRPISQAANRQDPLGTTMPAYVAKFNKNFDNADTTDQASAPTGGLGGARYASNTTTLNDASPAPAPAPSNQVDLGGGKGFISGPTPDQDNAPSPAGKTLGDISSNAVDSVTSGLGNVGKGIGKLFSYDPDTGLTDSQLAALGFLGGMFASPNRTFLGAVGTGLGTGIESYRQLRQQEIEQQGKNIEAYKFFQDRYVPQYDLGGNITGYTDKISGNNLPVNQYQQMMSGFQQQLFGGGVGKIQPPSSFNQGTQQQQGQSSTANPAVQLKPRAVEGTQEQPVTASSAAVAPANAPSTGAYIPDPSKGGPDAVRLDDPNSLQDGIAYERRMAALNANNPTGAQHTEQLKVYQTQLGKIVNTPRVTQQGTEYYSRSNPAPQVDAPPPITDQTPRGTIDPNTGAVKLASPNLGYTNSGGYAPDPEMLQANHVAKGQDKVIADAQALNAPIEKDFREAAQRTPEGIQSYLRLAAAAKQIQTQGMSTDRATLANQARGLGLGNIADQIMSEKDTAAAQTLLKNSIDAAIDKTANSFAKTTQGEFKIVTSQNTPNVDMPTGAFHPVVQSRLAGLLYQDKLNQEWQTAYAKGARNFNAFEQQFRTLNPPQLFVQSAGNLLGNFKGEDLPSTNNMTEGAVYVMPDQKTARNTPMYKSLLDKGLRPGDMFTFEGVNHNETDPQTQKSGFSFKNLKKINSMEDAYSNMLSAPAVTYGVR